MTTMMTTRTTTEAAGTPAKITGKQPTIFQRLKRDRDGGVKRLASGTTSYSSRSNYLVRR